MKMKLYGHGELVLVAKDRRDANKVMREEFGEVFTVKRLRGGITVTSDGGDTSQSISADEAVRMFGRGIVPQL